jgi:hypothetical protein
VYARLLLLACFTMVASCDNRPLSSDAFDVEISIDESNIFAAQSGSSIGVPWQIQNHGGGTIYLWRCGDTVLFEVQRLESVGWASYSAAICITSLDMSPIPLAPGATLTGTRTIDGPAGQYRLRVGAGEAPDVEATQILASDPFFLP